MPYYYFENEWRDYDHGLEDHVGWDFWSQKYLYSVGHILFNIGLANTVSKTTYLGGSQGTGNTIDDHYMDEVITSTKLNYQVWKYYRN